MKNLSRAQTKKALDYSVMDGTAEAVRTGITGKYLVPFALALGAGNEYIGLINALPELIRTITQAFTSKVLERFKSRKYVCILSATIQRLFWLPILLIPFLFAGNLWWLMFFVCLFYSFSAFTSTAWTSWIADLVPEKIRGRFFGKRNMFIDSATFFSALLAGWYLASIKNTIGGFSIIFLISLFFGFVSIYFLAKIPDVKQKTSHHKTRFSFAHFIHGVEEHKDHSNFVIFMTLTRFAVSFVSIFFTVYMLNVLKIGYLWFGIVVGAEMIVRIATQKYWGKLSDRFDDKRILKICYIGVPLTPFLWMFVSTPIQAVIVSVITGFFWCGFDLSTFNYLLDSTPRSNPIPFISNYRFLTGISNFIGPVLGGITAVYLADKTFLFLEGMQILFLFGFILRSIPALMLNRFHNIRIKRKVSYSDLFLKAVALYPLEAVEHAIEHAIHYITEMQQKIVKK
ncbi:MAG: MFS transporter [Candidatus Aenigmarchaeota archaeon]|nr:MFS transporter [Candidatus Aenigmarchaeota archaeon]